MKAFCTTAVLALVLYCVTSQSYARPTRDWTYADLFKEADLVVVANAISTKAVPNTGKLPEAGRRLDGGSMAALFQQVETTFHVHAAVKGQFKEQSIILVHFRWKTPDELMKEQKRGKSLQHVWVRNGPSLVEFPNEFFDEMLGKTVNTGPDCLLFLKVRKDGKCEPISGHVDPDDSVRWLTKRREPQPNSQQPQSPAPYQENDS